MDLGFKGEIETGTRTPDMTSNYSCKLCIVCRKNLAKLCKLCRDNFEKINIVHKNQQLEQWNENC
jgi:hypothetical protein